MRFYTGFGKFLGNILTHIWSLGKHTSLKLGEESYFFYLPSSIISQSRFPLDGFGFIFYCVTIKTIYLHTTRTLWKFAMRCSTNFNALSNVANALGNVANAFENKLQRVGKHCQQVEMHFRLISYAGFSQMASRTVLVPNCVTKTVSC